MAPGAAPPQASASITLRTLLDPTTLSEIRRIEAQGRAGATSGNVGALGTGGLSADALGKAAAALRTRAEALKTEAAVLRRLGQQK